MNAEERERIVQEVAERYGWGIHLWIDKEARTALRELAVRVEKETLERAAEGIWTDPNAPIVKPWNQSLRTRRMMDRLWAVEYLRSMAAAVKP